MANVWFFHHYATVPYRNGYLRPYRFAVHLSEHGFRTAVFCASYHHWSGENVIEGGELFKRETVDDVDFLYVNTPSSAAGMLARIKNMLYFSFRVRKVGKVYMKKTGKPEVIIASSPHPFTMIAGICFGKKYGIPCICEIRDLWPEAIFYGSRLKEKSLTGRILVAVEHWIYKRADALVFTKEGDTDYLKEHGWTTAQRGDIDLKKCFYINNGVEYDQYRNSIVSNPLDDPTLNDDTFKAIYTGAIRPVNNVRNIVDAAKILSEDKGIRFLIYGDGNQREALQKAAEQAGLTNIMFKGFVENKYIPFVLSRSSVNLLNYSSEKYNWARGNSSNKLFEYLASGKPVISTVKTGFSILQKYGCGIEMESQTPENLANAILAIHALPPEEYDNMCRNAIRGAKDFDYGRLTEKLLDAMAFAKENHDQ